MGLFSPPIGLENQIVAESRKMAQGIVSQGRSPLLVVLVGAWRLPEEQFC